MLAKRFDSKGGAGIVRAQRAGLVTGLIAARTSRATAPRAAQLGMRPLVQGAVDETEAFRSLV